MRRAHLIPVLRFGLLLLLTGLLLSVTAQLEPAGQPRPGRLPTDPGLLAELILREAAVTAGTVARMTAYALLPGLALGMLMGLRRGRPLDRVLTFPVSALMGLPSIFTIAILFWLVVFQRRMTVHPALLDLTLAAVVAAWMAHAVREAIARAKGENGRLLPREAVLGSLGGLLGQSGNILAVVLLANPSRPGLRAILVESFVLANPTATAGVLLLCALAILPLHLAGDLLTAQAPGNPRSPTQLSRSWLLVGGVLLAGVAAIALSSFGDPIRLSLKERFLPPGPDHLLGTDRMGRDFLARLAAGARLSLGMAAGAAAAAGVGGAALGLLARRLGWWGTVLAPRLYGPSLTAPFLLVAAALQAARLSPSLLALLVGLGSSVLVAYPIRRLDGRLRGPAAWSVLAGLALVAAQALLTESFIHLLHLPLWAPKPSVGLLIQEASNYLNSAPHLVLWPMLTAAAGVTGLLLVGRSLMDMTGSEAGEQ